MILFVHILWKSLMVSSSWTEKWQVAGDEGQDSTIYELNKINLNFSMTQILFFYHIENFNWSFLIS